MTPKIIIKIRYNSKSEDIYKGHNTTSPLFYKRDNKNKDIVLFDFEINDKNLSSHILPRDHNFNMYY